MSHFSGWRDYTPPGAIKAPGKAGAMTRAEERDQRALFEWISLQWFAPNFFHVPNERASATERAILSGLGVVAGVPDNWLVLPRGRYVGHVHELKRADGGTATKAQRAWLERLAAAGWDTAICYGLDDAIGKVSYYVSLGEPCG